MPRQKGEAVQPTKNVQQFPCHASLKGHAPVFQGKPRGPVDKKIMEAFENSVEKLMKDDKIHQF
jgi:hypothetical protein